jgi:hypothetical protein
MLQEHVKSTFPHKTVIIPEDAGLAVLKGAVQFGFNPKVFCVERYSSRAPEAFGIPRIHLP